MVRNPPANAGDSGSIPGGKDHVEEEMATPSSILAWKMPWTEEPGGLWSIGSHRVGQTEVTEHTDARTEAEEGLFT